MIKLKDIKGLLGDDRKIPIGNREYHQGILDCIKIQGERSIGLNREKLAKLIHNLAWPSSIWEKQCELVKERYYKRADAIISSEAELLEYRGEE